MKVLFPFTGDTVGGSHLSALELVLGLDSRRYQPIVAIHECGALAQYLNDRRIPFMMAPSISYTTGNGRILPEIAKTLAAAFPLGKFLRQHRINIVHTNDNRMHLTWSAASKLSNSRFVWHQRTPYSSRRLNIYAPLADRIITISDFCRSSFTPYMSRNAQVISNPFSARFSHLDKCEQKKYLLSEMGIASARTVVGFISNLTEQKRPLIFVEVAARLRDLIGSDVVFPMIGAERGKVCDDVRRRISDLGLERQCRILGPRFPVEPLLSGFDALIAPAVREGFGRTLVEAMYCRVPVIATDDGGHREIIARNETGILVPPDDVKAFADATIKVLLDRNFANDLADHAARTALARFSVEAHVAQVQAVYDSLVH